MRVLAAENYVRNDSRVQELAAEHDMLHEDDNLYAHLLDFILASDINILEAIHIDFPPHRLAKDEEDVSIVASAEDALRASGRERMHYPNQSFEYFPEYREKQPGSEPSIGGPFGLLQIIQSRRYQLQNE
ncbi:hypothetical protein Clacol_004509 [Clathrus columnatus]|uniref:Uncharacterized protein n=1 Tax=Clathrus columnatus TaxID=1419009 RepID=A0AAV5AAS6_9AGAM|nr:hypothetical protein Clacol_004509 [Clathrus columnatus]